MSETNNIHLVVVGVRPASVFIFIDFNLQHSTTACMHASSIITTMATMNTNCLGLGEEDTPQS